MITNALCVDVDDLIASGQEAGVLGEVQAQYYVDQETDYLLSGLSGLGVKASFFIPGFFSKKFPEKVKEIADLGHQIASHGTLHTWVDRLSPEQYLQDIVQSKNDLEQLSGQPVNTYKAPIWGIDSNSLWALDHLAEAGFKFDHSLMPKPYKALGAKPGSVTTLSNGLTLIPPTHYFFGEWGLPLFGGFYNAYIPLSVQKILFKKINQNGQPFNLYFHPFEFKSFHSRVERFKISFRTGLYSWHSGCYQKHLAELSRHFEFSSLAQAYSGVSQDA